MTLALRLLARVGSALNLGGVDDAAPDGTSAAGKAWCEAFAALYAAHKRCSAADAHYIAEMVHPVLGDTPPAQALQTLETSAAFVED